MKFKTILIILGVLFVVFLVFKACTSYVGKKVGESVSGIMVTKKEFSFADTDFTTGEYAIIIDDQNPAILIDNPEILESSKGEIETDVSWMNYLPGEGAGASGLRLYKNRTLVKSRIARKFKTFKVGNLREYGKPVEFKSIYEPRVRFEKQKDSLEKNENVFITRATEVSPEGYEYRFTLKCPSILVSEKDSTFNDMEYGKMFAQRIKAGLSEFSNFNLNDNASNSMETSPLLLIHKDGATSYVRDSETNKTISLMGFQLHSAQLTFFCTKEFYGQILTHDFNTAFKRVGLSKEEIKSLIREKIGSENPEFTLAAVLESMFRTEFEIGELYQQKYELRYFELLASEGEELP